jgi:hypothetical protein
VPIGFAANAGSAAVAVSTKLHNCGNNLECFQKGLRSNLTAFGFSQRSDLDERCAWMPGSSVPGGRNLVGPAAGLL